MYDFHSHILPGIDDGSEDIQTSIKMLRECARQGITHLAVTPHFYADRTTPEAFLKMRMESWQKLYPYLDEGLPEIKLGAEVHYFEGICRSKDISRLCLGNTSILLLEMPFTAWNSRMLDVLMELNGKQGIRILLAHFERYLAYQPSKTWRMLIENGVLLQSNGEFFLDGHTRRKALHFLKKDYVCVLGSDCHNTSTRKPNLGEAYKLISDKCGAGAVRRLNMRGSELFNEVD